ncbi:alpha/beta hydrolase [Phytohabitans houttuyneae]|uniref:Acetylhydrolase n=1 Tax=Phytohabitans houttuyneae TaxID=1076126 RepID=A0A6V8KVC0_9ACTN|nr:alpha/beta hydrolase [Phytohabitans houttuyneae]GFJ84525.1 acetylhydrolase [Phytohabitans houttuyneae]
MPALPELAPMLARIEAARAHVPDPALPVAERRAAIHRGMDQRAAAVALPPPPVAVTDHAVPVEGGEITVRTYRPDVEGPLPAHLYVHGGGWWLGTLAHRDAACARLAVDARCVVASVAHRLAPEHWFPVPVRDCVAALMWLAGRAAELGVDASRLSIGGDSSGANLAAATALVARDEGGPALVAQVLEIPALDLTMSQPSVNATAGPVVLTRDDLAENIARYADPADLRHPYASPLLAPDLSGLPPALVMTAELDILRDDGAAYGRRLVEAGGSAEVVEWAGHVHGSHEMTAVLVSAREWQARAAAFLRAHY